MTSQRHLLALQLLSIIKITLSFPEDVYKAEYKWIEKGDINIGAILSIHSPDPSWTCTSDIQDKRNVLNVEALSFAVQEINDKRSDLLPNLKLGFAILDDCLSPSMALARAIQFMPRSVRNHNMGPFSETCEICQMDRNITQIGFYDVVGVIGTYTSKLSIIVADVLHLFKIPQISHTATSNILSDKTRFPYFFRMVPPDRYQVMAIVSLLQHFNWTHVSIVYSEGSYGREGVKELDNLLQKQKNYICIEEKLELMYNSEDKDFDRVLQKLEKNSDVLVVIAFVEKEDAVLLIKAIKRSRVKDKFTWIGSDSFSLVMEEFPESCQHVQGSITVEPFSRNIERFERHIAYIQTEKGQLENGNPWLKELARKKVANHNNSNLTHRLSNNKSVRVDDNGYIKSSFVNTFLLDSVYALAFALDNVLRKHCDKSQLISGEDVSRCISRVGIFDELKTFNFDSSSGKLKFNENGDIMTKYVLRQCKTYDHGLQQIGLWDMSDETLDINHSLLSWKENNTPVSTCPKPCTDTVGTIYSFGKESCCWKCVKCKPNEIVSTNVTRCEVCSEHKWPDENRRECKNIEPVYFGLTNTISIGLCTSAILGTIICLCICGVMIKYRDEQVVKCSSIELSAMIMVGTISTFLLTSSFLSQPTVIKCYINKVGFSLVFTITYAPLLVKTNRIYRIFNAGRRTIQKPCLISKSSQVMISLVLIILQVNIPSIY